MDEMAVGDLQSSRSGPSPGDSTARQNDPRMCPGFACCAAVYRVSRCDSERKDSDHIRYGQRENALRYSPKSILGTSKGGVADSAGTKGPGSHGSRGIAVSITRGTIHNGVRSASWNVALQDRAGFA